LSEISEKLLHLSFLGRNAFQDGTLLTPLPESFNSTFRRFRVFRAISSIATCIVDVEPAGDVMGFARQPQCCGTIAFVSMSRTVAFHAKSVELGEYDFRNDILERLIVEQIVEVGSKWLWQSFVMVDPFDDLFAENSEFGDCRQQDRDVRTLPQSHQALPALATSVEGTRS
jgi:hypothetical protein